MSKLLFHLLMGLPNGIFPSSFANEHVSK